MGAALPIDPIEPMPPADRPDPRGWSAPPPAPAAPAATAPTPGAAPERRRPRVGTVVAIVALALALLGAAAGAGVAAWRSYDAGAAWRERALAEEERADAAEAVLEAERERAAALEARVAALEAEVLELEERVVALAGEKAGAEDQALIAQETAERLAALSRFASETGTALQRCIGLSLELTNDIVAAVNAGTLDAEATNRRIADVNRVCGEAQADYDELRRRVDALAP